jgi:putative molybdopterin biosynthesis protein
MKRSSNVNSIRAAKVLGDRRRLTILQLLMQEPGTLSQLGRQLKDHPAKVRHHLKLLEEHGFVELTSTRVVRGFVEKYYRATSDAFFVNLAILPEPVGAGSIIVMGSHDLALDLLAEDLIDDKLSPDLFCVPVGSLDGLIALRQGLCQFAGCHLPEKANDEFNLSFVRHLFPGRSMTLVVLGYRHQGIIVQKRNPKGIRDIGDFVREDITIANRQPGSGTRLWLDRRLTAMGIDSSQIDGYAAEVNTHYQVSQRISQGKAEAGIAVQGSAEKFGLDFIPLYEERYDLVVPTEAIGDNQFMPLFDRIVSSRFREKVANLGGYNTSRTGETILVTS